MRTGTRGRVLATLLAAIVAVAWLAVARDARAVGDPSLVWQTFQTQHFRVHHHKRLESIAKRVAEVCEDVHGRLVQPLGWTPGEITNVVVTDDTDSANGSATALPYNTVRLFVTAPDDLSPLADYDDWQLELITHEYTHILHTDHITGLPAIYNAIVGKQYSPNQMQPRWLLEGLAVLLETRYTTGGRNRSSIFDMYLRADVLEDNIAGLDQISHAPRRWPQGNLWYLYGSHFLEYVENLYGFEALRQVAADYGDEIIPYGINRAIHRATGKTYVELYRGWIAWMQKRYARQKAEVAAKGLREGRRATFHGQEAFHPRYMPAAAGAHDKGFARRISYYRNDTHTTTGLYAIGVRDGAKAPTYGIGELLTRTAGASTPAWLPDGSLLYDSVESSKMKLYFYWDLFRRAPREWGGETEQGERLSFGLRANEPAVSPDGDRVAYVVNKQGTSYLYLSELDGDQPFGAPRKLVPNERFDQVYTPRWSPDGTRIAFSAWNSGGYRDVKIVDVATGALTAVTRDRALDTGPVFSPDGQTLYFSSDRTGIANIYAYDLVSGGLKQVTNVINGAFQPEVDETGKHLAYVGYTHEGYDIFELDLDPKTFRDAEPYVDTRGTHVPAAKPLSLKATPYNPLPTLRPYTWEWESRPDSFGQAVIVTTRGGDVVGLHFFAASLTASFNRGITGTDLFYVYRNMPFDTRARLWRYVGLRGGFRFGDETPLWAEESLGIESGITAPLAKVFSAQSLAISYAFSRFRPLDGFPTNAIDPYARPAVFPQTGYLAAIRLGWSWSNVQRFLWSVGPEKGFAFSANVDLARPELASQYSVLLASYNSVGYFPMPWARHHVLALHAQGGASSGDWGRRGAFVLGGFADIPLPDALRNLLFQPGIALRGYRPGARFGDAFHLFNVEYRFPLLNVDRGYETLPAFLHRFYGNVFADYGDASFQPIDLLRMKLGLGAELLTDLSVGYFQPITIRVGVARGTSEGGVTQTYVVLSQLF
ncbi:MAG: PD40 domain-containing protein [Deltaproteobacteria bacterium]|nr:PD40 domain-containing protein [Deltaproteobacteria bacterium]